jgi:hypothetical protein
MPPGIYSWQNDTRYHYRVAREQSRHFDDGIAFTFIACMLKAMDIVDN